MKKIIFLLTICSFLTGCTVNYNLEITDNNFTEKITGNVLNSEIEINKNATSISPYLDLLSKDQVAFNNNSNIFYNKKKNKNENKTDFEYTYTFNENNFINSNLLNNCFEYYTFENKDNQYYISLAGKFHCAYTDEIKVNVTTDYKVTAHNAKEKKDNTYTWTIEKENIDNVSLFITIDKNNTNSNNIFDWSTFKTIGLIILLILSGVAIFIGKSKLKD